MNEDLLNPRMHNFKDVLLLNSLQNIIDEPTRQLGFLDPIILHEDMLPLTQGIIRVPPEISVHSATYVHLQFEYKLHRTFTRNIWMYKYANYELFNKRKSEFNCSCLQEGTVSEASLLFTNIFIEVAKMCILNKTIIVREGDKPWYDSELRMNSRKRDRLNKTALKQVIQMTDKNNMFKNTENNHKTCKAIFFMIIWIILFRI